MLHGEDNSATKRGNYRKAVNEMESQIGIQTFGKARI